MKAIIHETYIIPISSVNFIHWTNPKEIKVYLKSPIDGSAYVCLHYDESDECAVAYNDMLMMFRYA